MLNSFLRLSLLVIHTYLLTQNTVYSAEYFSATDDVVTDLFDVEAIIISRLKTFIEKQERTMQQVNKFVQNLEREHVATSKNKSHHLEYPVNAYLVIKRLTNDVHEINTTLYEQQEDLQEIFQNIRNTDGRDISMPESSELYDVATSIATLQEIYDLNVESLANGYYKNVRRSSKLTASDCLTLGTLMYEQGSLKSSIPWFTVTLDRIEDGSLLNEIAESTKYSILWKILFANRQIGNYTEAIKFSDEMLQIYPADSIIEQYRKELLDESKLKEATTPSPGDHESFHVELNGDQIYKQLCNKQLVPSPAQQAPLRCRYETNGLPFLTIAPFKVEEASLDPYVIIFRGVMSDQEIETLKLLSKRKLERAKVFDDRDKVNKVRISKYAGFQDSENKVVNAITVRVQDMTMLTRECSEALQVANYGIGGHYMPHYDFFYDQQLELISNSHLGNRIATTLFYMSNVEEGGATVFPLLQIALWPEKGSASFWYNLYRSGVGDLRTLHAGCPVMIGSKWVSNKWVRFNCQWPIRPCFLKPDHPPHV